MPVDDFYVSLVTDYLTPIILSLVVCFRCRIHVWKVDAQPRTNIIDAGGIFFEPVPFDTIIDPLDLRYRSLEHEPVQHIGQMTELASWIAFVGMEPGCKSMVRISNEREDEPVVYLAFGNLGMHAADFVHFIRFEDQLPNRRSAGLRNVDEGGVQLIRYVHKRSDLFAGAKRKRLQNLLSHGLGFLSIGPKVSRGESIPTIAEYLRQKAMEIADAAQARVSELDHVIAKIEQQKSEKETERDMARGAFQRLANYPVSIGGNYQCPDCWVNYGKMSPLQPISSANRHDFFRCGLCKYEAVI